MQIEKHAVVTIDYTLKDAEGEVLDSSVGQTPLTYLHGAGTLVDGLEEALGGKQAGDALQVQVAPDKGYGVRDESLVGPVERRRIGIKGDVEVGMQFRVDLEEGFDIVTVTAIDGDAITLDANHPLAGLTLHFEVDVKDVRESTPEEREHGHAHSPEGHEH